MSSLTAPARNVQAEQPSAGSAGSSRPDYWRSLSELESRPDFQEMLAREFPEAAAQFPEGVSRRRWLQLMGASLALGGLTGCWEKEIISPFVQRPAGRIPGVPQRFATSWELGGVARPLVVTCYDGRPIKVEGNPEHPASLGAATSLSQALILQLYDPDRAVGVLHKKGTALEASSWDAFAEAIRPLINAQREKKGAGLRILAESSSSVTTADLRARFEQIFPEAKWGEYNSVSRDNEREGAKLAFGRVVRTQVDLTDANVILSLDSDFLGSHPNSLRLTRQYASRRTPDTADATMNRLYVVETLHSGTGAAADHRLAARTADIPAILARIAAAVKEKLDGKKLPPEKDFGSRFIDAVADDLVANQGKAAIVVGPRQSPAVHAAAHRLNALLKNVGAAISYTEEPGADRPTGVAAIKSLTDEMLTGQVETLVILGGNPVQTAPADVDFVDGLKKVATTVHLGDYSDETSLLCGWHLPAAHPFEVWGDSLSTDGTLTLAQPLIEPLHGGKSVAEVVAILIEDELRTGDKLVRRAISRYLPKNSDQETAWQTAVHDGFLSQAVLAKQEVAPVAEEPAAVESTSAEAMEVVFAPGPGTYDGRFANNGWLQELPELITKLTWDNAAFLSPKTAAEKGLAIGDLVQVRFQGREITLPVFTVPGHANNSLGLWLGYGRTAGGHVAGYVTSQSEPTLSVGTRVEALRSTDAFTAGLGAEIKKTGKTHKMATTQDHHAIDKQGLEMIGRRLGKLVREAPVEEFKAHEDLFHHEPYAVHHPALESLWEERSYADGHKWGMSIDLSKCVGCNACMIACQSENNIPIVGKEQVIRGREMHWIRIDRYFAGDVDEPQVVTQPVACHHCENAPCEEVCPVAATVHSHEGLNDMVYNRCIGTRYCANNCPYKVRRFNYFNNNKKYSQANQDLQTLMLNPEVTVRARGVMEKCTYCTQRISAVKIVAKNERRAINDGEIVTACQQACPAGAIEFGDLNMSSSKVAKAHEKARSYFMLEELNNKPRTAYLARIRNPHPSLAKEKPEGHGAHEHHG
jgi:MoCo/4Fe-4S cofactor protein with predicted Tat translocation signal